MRRPMPEVSEVDNVDFAVAWLGEQTEEFLIERVIEDLNERTVFKVYVLMPEVEAVFREGLEQMMKLTLARQVFVNTHDMRSRFPLYDRRVREAHREICAEVQLGRGY